MNLIFVVVKHSTDDANEVVNDTDRGRVDMTVVVTTTYLVATTETVTQTTTESFTVNHTVTAELYCTPSPSPSQSSGTAGSTSCSSSDTDNTPIYVAVAIAIVGLLITVVVIIVGVFLCRHYYWNKKQSAELSAFNTLIVNRAEPLAVEVKSSLYPREGLE